MNVDLNSLSLLTFKTFSVIHVVRKVGYRIKGFFSDIDDDIMTIETQSLSFKRENGELPTDTSSSRFGPTIMDAEPAKQRFERIPKKKTRSSGGVVVQLFAYGTKGAGFDSRSRCFDFRDWISPAL